MLKISNFALTAAPENRGGFLFGDSVIQSAGLGQTVAVAGKLPVAPIENLPADGGHG